LGEDTHTHCGQKQFQETSHMPALAWFKKQQQQDMFYVHYNFHAQDYCDES